MKCKNSQSTHILEEAETTNAHILVATRSHLIDENNQEQKEKAGLIANMEYLKFRSSFTPNAPVHRVQCTDW